MNDEDLEGDYSNDPFLKGLLLDFLELNPDGSFVFPKEFSLNMKMELVDLARRRRDSNIPAGDLAGNLVARMVAKLKEEYGDKIVRDIELMREKNDANNLYSAGW